MEDKKYSIWAVPSEPAFSELSNKIEALSQKYGEPRFIPHLSIVTSVPGPLKEIEEKLENVLNQVEVMTLSFLDISFSTTYFQSVFVRVKPTPALLDLNLKLKKEFNLENKLYMPHISLLYGVDDMYKRQNIVKEIKLESRESVFNGLTVCEETPDPATWVSSLEVPFSSAIRK